MNKKMLMDTFDLFDKCDAVVKNRYIKAGSAVAPHWHDYFELEIVLSGAAEQIYNEEKIIMKRGCAYLLTYRDFHAVRAIEDTRLINLRFKESLVAKEILKQITINQSGAVCDLNEREIKSALGKMRIISCETKEKKPFGDIAVFAAVSQLLIMILRKQKRNTKNFAPQVICEAVCYVNMNFRNKLTIKKLAERLSVSENYLGTLFKKHTGVNFNEYLNDIRLKYACNLLSGSQMTAEEIAFAAGYSSSGYFSRVFKNKFQKTPGEYKNSLIRL